MKWNDFGLFWGPMYKCSPWPESIGQGEVRTECSVANCGFSDGCPNILKNEFGFGHHSARRVLSWDDNRLLCRKMNLSVVSVVFIWVSLTVVKWNVNACNDGHNQTGNGNNKIWYFHGFLLALKSAICYYLPCRKLVHNWSSGCMTWITLCGGLNHPGWLVSHWCGCYQGERQFFFIF